MKKPLPDKEWTIVLSCCRDMFEIHKTGVPVIEKNTDWQRVVSIAQKHGLVNFVYLRLAKHCRKLISEEVLTQLKTIYFQNSIRNTYLGACLIKILNLLEQNHIEAIPFKGPVQAEMIYNDIGARFFSDLDILVQRENVVQARDLLFGLGFKTDVPIPEIQTRSYLKKENFFQLADPTKGINIDLHWEITGRYNLMPIHYPLSEEYIHHATLLGKKCKTLNYEDLLIYLCIHGTSHCWEKLELIYSVAKILTSSRISNWEGILQKAKNLKCRRMVLLGLCLAKYFFDADLPEVIQSAIQKDKRIKKQADYVIRKIIYHDMAFTERLSWRFSPFHFQIRDSRWDGVKYLLRLFFQPTIREWDKYPLPAWLLPLYYILRPYRLIKEGLLKQHA